VVAVVAAHLLRVRWVNVGGQADLHRHLSISCLEASDKAVLEARTKPH
jgi:hypothetical protein